MSDKNTKQEKMDKRGRKRRRRKGSLLIDLLLLMIFLICGFYVGGTAWRNWQQKQNAEYEKLIAEHPGQRWSVPILIPSLPDNVPGESMPYVSPIDFESLKVMNPDIVAWLKIPGTVIDYPIVQADDNDKYLHTDFEGKQSSAGAIFLDCDSESSLLGHHSVLYGHHMRNGSMFAQIVKFKDEAFFKENREIIIYLPDQELHLRTIAALYGDASGEKRRTVFDSQEMFDQYIDDMTKACNFRELPPDGTASLYSFVTCSYEFDNARTILYAVLEEPT